MSAEQEKNWVEVAHLRLLLHILWTDARRVTHAIPCQGCEQGQDPCAICELALTVERVSKAMEWE